MQKASFQKIKLDPKFPVRSIIMEAKNKDELFYCHYHPNIEIILVTNGSIDMIIDNKSFLLTEGDIAFVNPNQLHYGHAGDLGATVHLIVLSYSILGQISCDPTYLKYIDKLNRNILLLPNKLIDDSLIKGTVVDLLTYSDSKEIGKEIAIQGLFLLLLSGLYRRKLLLKNNNITLNTQTNKDHTILDYIEDNYSKPLRIAELSSRFGFSEDYFTKYFKKLTRQTPINYINNLRIFNSQYMLQVTDLSISEIGFRVGYESTSYFCKTFKLRCGESPSKYKRRLENRYT